MSEIVSLLIGEAFFVLALIGLGSLLLEGVVELARSRRTGAIRNGLAVGRTVYRSSDAKAFERARRRRVVQLVLLIPPIVVFGLMALSLLVGAVAASRI